MTREQNARRKRKRRARIAFFSAVVLVLAALLVVIGFLIVGVFQRSDKEQPGKITATIATTTTTVAAPDPDLLLVNHWHPLKEEDENTIELVKLSNGESVSARIYPALQQMFDAAREDGVYATVRSGYRSRADQQDIMDTRVARYKKQGMTTDEAKEKAESEVAAPGTSEHETGLAADINGDHTHSSNEQVYTWLAENAYQYGFILRYADDKQDITGVVGEAWHYRYVGKKAAAEIYQRQITLEEYLHAVSVTTTRSSGNDIQSDAAA